MIVVFVAGWTYAAAALYDRSGTVPAASGAAPPSVVSQLTSAVLEPAATPTPFLNEAALSLVDPLRGESGKVWMVLRNPGEPLTERSTPGLETEYLDERGKAVIAPGLTAPDTPGIYKVAVALNQARKPVDDFSLITLVPFTEKQTGRIGLYFLGNWPYEAGGRPRSMRYAAPVGFIEVTRQNKELRVSEHFRIGDFLTKDQASRWPKYLLLDPTLLDKLELTIAELEKNGIEIEHVTVMSGFRTPRYNVAGGNTEGRANLSRHMYGDGADVFVDNDRNGVIDDLDGNGRADTRDAEVMARAVEAVERAEPSLVGGIGIYPAYCGHGPFVHVDVRGYRARWRGSGNG